jgi:pilus assembly protein CpaB
MPSIQDLLQRVPEGARRAVVPLVLAVLFGMTALLLSNRWRSEQMRQLAQERQRLMERYPEPIPVIVASQDIPANTTLTAEHLAQAGVPPLFVQPYAVNNPDELIGMVTVAPMAKGEQILKNKLRSPSERPRHDEADGLSSLTPEGRRAVSIIVDTLSGVGGFVRPGDQVDILWIPGGAQGQQAEPVTVTLFQDVPVLAVGGTMVGSDGGGEAQPSSDQYTVTIGLGPQETSLLLFARQQGQLQLALRPKSEKGEVPVVPASMQMLMQKVLGVLPQEPGDGGPPTREVEVFRGLQRSVVVIRGPGQGTAVVPPSAGAPTAEQEQAMPPPAPEAAAPMPSPRAQASASAPERARARTAPRDLPADDEDADEALDDDAAEDEEKL